MLFALQNLWSPRHGFSSGVGRSLPAQGSAVLGFGSPLLGPGAATASIWTIGKPWGIPSDSRDAIYIRSGRYTTLKNDGVRPVGIMTFPTEWKNKTCSKSPTR